MRYVQFKSGLIPFTVFISVPIMKMFKEFIEIVKGLIAFKTAMALKNLKR
jgi:hypothetical protein